jgi:hypothetical protein
MDPSTRATFDRLLRGDETVVEDLMAELGSAGNLEVWSEEMKKLLGDSVDGDVDIEVMICAKSYCLCMCL